MNFIDHTGHIFSLESYSMQPIGYEYDENTFSFNGGNGTGGAVEGEMGVYSYTMGDRPVHISCALSNSTSPILCEC